MTEIDGVVGGIYGTNNVYIYRFQGSKRHDFIPWDKDLTFYDPMTPLLEGFEKNVLLTRLLNVPEFRDAYLLAFLRAVERFGGVGGWADQELTRQYNLIHDLALNEPYKQCIQDTGSIASCGPKEFEDEVKNMRSFIARRAEFVAGFVKDVGIPNLSGLPTIESVAGGWGSPYLQPSIGAYARVTGSNFGAIGVGGITYLPRTLNGTFLAIEGARAPLLTNMGDKIDFQVPWESAQGSANIVAVVNGQTSNTIEMPVKIMAPAILAMTHNDGTLVEPSSPARRGETIALYASGLGDLVLEIPSGVAAPPTPLVAIESTYAASVSGTPATVLSAGLAPGIVGLYLVSVVIPTDVSLSDSTQVTLTIGEQNVSVAIAVR